MRYHGNANEGHLPWVNDGSAEGASKAFVDVAGAERSAQLKADLRRFESEVDRRLSLMDVMTPLGVWLWLKGFSKDFVRLGRAFQMSM